LVEGLAEGGAPRARSPDDGDYFVDRWLKCA